MDAVKARSIKKQFAEALAQARKARRCGKAATKDLQDALGKDPRGMKPRTRELAKRASDWEDAYGAAVDAMDTLQREAVKASW